MSAVVMAALAAAAGVWGAWEALGVAQDAAPRAGRLVALLRLAGRDGHEPTAPERRRLAVLGAGALLAAGWLLAGPVAGVVLGAAGPALVGQVVALRRRRWRRALAAGVPLVARALADALAGGHSIRAGLEELGRPGALPGVVGAELRETRRRLDVGEPTDAVLERLRRRGADPAWDTLVAAILLQRDAGGDLARLLRGIAAAQEEARRTEADAAGLTAQARATARLVAGLPAAGLALTELTAPGTVAALAADPRSRVLLLAAAAVGTVGFVLVGRLARMEDA